MTTVAFNTRILLRGVDSGPDDHRTPADPLFCRTQVAKDFTDALRSVYLPLLTAVNVNGADMPLTCIFGGTMEELLEAVWEAVRRKGRESV